MTSNIATSGQPTATQIKQIVEQKYSTVINLSSSITNQILANEGEIISSHSMNYINIPVTHTKPQLKQLLLFCSFMDSLEQQKVWIHCARNYQSSAFLYMYLRFKRGFNHDQARSPIFDQWPKDEVWFEFMKMAAEKLQTSKFNFRPNADVA